MKKFSFKILTKDKKTQARTGLITTLSGKKIFTPAFVPVGTQATVKSLSPEDLLKIGVQVIFVNSYHLHLRPGERTVKNLGGLSNFMKWAGPIMTDSGGFQVFSLGNGKRKQALGLTGGNLVKTSSEGVRFRSHLDGKYCFLTPRKAIRIQKDLGSDIMMALDDCSAYPVTFKRARKAMERTHLWAQESIRCRQRLDLSGALYGIIQGSVFKSLRLESAKFITSLPFDGIAVGGLAVGESKRQMRQVMKWLAPWLPETKPCHLLGVGELDDIVDLVQSGVDTFDCVMPTRLGRMGWIIGQNGRYEIAKKEFSNDWRPPDTGCKCWVCCQFSRAYLHHLFRSRELLAYRLASYHNLSFMISFLAKIRKSLNEGTFSRLVRKFRNES
ncbi:MAG: tRNA guanosine(34) transglycosylase Tgt [Candidatus Pacebacteria bacterium]|nr:tRNA guanosine(34) transglycosylase Tgt [Candidatus Paceibacterota bacterium]